uniref:DUF4124 domain-containing protein n=1 Tax=Geobacter metallireducens TaxID=28232 RepID=A0A831UEZ0_GEOME
MVRSACTAMILALAVAAHADIYRWVDQGGTVNYTEDPGKIPKKYRKKVTVISEGGVPAAEVTETAIGQGEKGKAPESGDRDAGNAPVPKRETRKAVYGGKDEDAWKAEFRTLRGEIKAHEAELAARRAKLANPGTMSRGEFLGIQREARMLEEKLSGLNGKLNALEENAQRSGVPLELRQ